MRPHGLEIHICDRNNSHFLIYVFRAINAFIQYIYQKVTLARPVYVLVVTAGPAVNIPTVIM